MSPRPVITKEKAKPKGGSKKGVTRATLTPDQKEHLQDLFY
jgi:hypothetical protein